MYSAFAHCFRFYSRALIYLLGGFVAFVVRTLFICTLMFLHAYVCESPLVRCLCEYLIVSVCVCVCVSPGGLVPEFVNPKYADAAKNKFKKPTRLECMMQVRLFEQNTY